MIKINSQDAKIAKRFFPANYRVCIIAKKFQERKNLTIQAKTKIQVESKPTEITKQAIDDRTLYSQVVQNTS